MRGTAYQVAGPRVVEVGNKVPYASLHQFGGRSVIPLNASVKTWIAGWTATKRGRPYTSKLYPLLDLPEWSQEVYQRPFIGITPEAGQEIRRIVEVFVGTGRRP
jgi:phage gpG-like protein